MASLAIVENRPSIIELTGIEILAVIGGTSVPPRTTPGTCPPGTTLTEARYDGGGNLTGISCQPKQSTLSKAKDKVTENGIVQLMEAAVEAGKKLLGWD